MSHRETMIRLVGDEHMRQVLRSSQEYLQGMSDADVVARRGVLQPEHTRTPDSGEGVRLRAVVHNAQRLLMAVAPRVTRALESVPWNVALVGGDVENGWPHTHGDVIFIPQGLQPDACVLAHERVHVYQRLQPLQANDLICNYWGYAPYCSRQRFRPDAGVALRSNPDLNSLLYSWNGHVRAQVYRSARPQSLADSHVLALVTPPSSALRDARDAPQLPHCVRQTEHPFEIMACLLAGVACGRVSAPEWRLPVMQGLRRWLAAADV